jgi:PAS domain S-box-containing protein
MPESHGREAAPIWSEQAASNPETAPCERPMEFRHSHDDARALVAKLDRISAALEPGIDGERQAVLRQFDQELRAHVRRSEILLARYEFLFEAAPDPYVVTDSDGVITEANAAARALLGADVPEVLLRPLVEFVSSSDRDLFHGWLRQLHAGRPEARWDTFFDVPGHQRPVPIEVSLADDLDGIGYRWLLRDQRERTIAENQLRAVAEQEHRAADDLRAEARVNTQFLRSLSHDLRAPIGALIHQSELLTAEDLAPEIRRRSQAAMEDNARLLRQILEALVDIERYALGELDLRIAPTALVELVGLLPRADDADGIHVGPVDPSLVVAIDRDVMRRALLTLAHAVRSSDHGEVHVAVDRAGDTTTIEMRSGNAHSLAEDRIDIRLARTLIEMHEGSLQIASSDGDHSATVSLPLAPGTG